MGRACSTSECRPFGPMTVPYLSPYRVSFMQVFEGVASSDDVATIRSNLRRFTDDEAKLDVLVERVLSLKNHGVEELYSPELTPGQIEWFLDQQKPPAAVRDIFARLLPAIKVNDWESFVFHLSAAWDQFLGTVGPNDRLVFLRRISGNPVRRRKRRGRLRQKWWLGLWSDQGLVG
jgi:hypothetical protein